MNLILNILMEKRTRLVMHSVDSLHVIHATYIRMCKENLKKRNLEVVISNESYLQVKKGLEQEMVQQEYKE
jgi:hypothetical protein